MQTYLLLLRLLIHVIESLLCIPTLCQPPPVCFYHFYYGIADFSLRHRCMHICIDQQFMQVLSIVFLFKAVNHRAAHNRCLANILAEHAPMLTNICTSIGKSIQKFSLFQHFFKYQVSIFFFLCGILYSGNFIIFTPSRYPECQRHFLHFQPAHGSLCFLPMAYLIPSARLPFSHSPFFPHCFPYTNAQTAYPHFL